MREFAMKYREKTVSEEAAPGLRNAKVSRGG